VELSRLQLERDRELVRRNFGQSLRQAGQDLIADARVFRLTIGEVKQALWVRLESWTTPAFRDLISSRPPPGLRSPAKSGRRARTRICRATRASSGVFGVVVTAAALAGKLPRPRCRRQGETRRVAPVQYLSQ
jgi:hypothetical protein